MATTQEKWQEIANRGLQDNFDPQTRAKFDEAVKRGLITIAANDQVEQPQQESELPTIGALPENPPLSRGEYQGETQGLDALTPEQREGLPSMTGMVNAAGQGASAGFLDEAQAGLLATIGVNLPESMGGLPDSVGLGEAYKGIRDEIRGKNKEFDEEHPYLSTGLKVAGGIATGTAGAAKLAVTLPKAVTAGQTLAKGTAIAGIEGGVAGLGMSEEETIGGDIKETLKGAAIAAPFGFVAGGVMAYQASKAAKSAALIKAIEVNPNGKAVKAMIKGGAKHEALPVMKEAVKQGFDDGVVGTVIGANDVDKSAMRKMVNIYVKNQNNPKLALRNRPADVIGESISKRYKLVHNLNRNAGKEVKSAAESLKGQSVEFSPVVDDFIQSLDDIGVKLNTKGRVSIDFDGSDFEGLDEAQKIIKNVANRMLNTKTPDAYDVHRLKKFIDNNVSYGASSKKGAEKTAEDMIKNLRKKLDGVLDGKFSAYDKANTSYSKTINALNDVDALIGKQSNVRSANFEKTLGTLARRISSNAISGGRVDDALSKLDDVALEMGGKFGDDFESLVVFSNELERRLPTQIRTSLQGTVENIKPTDMAISKAAEIYNKAKGVSDENALIALRRLVNQKF